MREANENKYEQLRLEGRNPVLEALSHDKAIDKILFKKGEIQGTLKIILAKARERHIVTQEVAKQKLDELSESGNHQGVIAICSALEYSSISHMLTLARSKSEDPLILLLDGITDPYNLGAIIRTAEASGAHGVVIPKRRAVGVTAIVGKASAGAIEHIPIAKVENLSASIEELKKEGLWVACADTTGSSMYEASLKGPLALVIGGEGQGVSRLVHKNCDFTVSIPLYGRLSSLNASVAAAVVLYEAVRQRNR